MLNNEDLIKKVKSYNRFFDPNSLTKAYNFALKAHQNQRRDAGEPYIIHPIAVADILTELKLDSATITTGFYMIQSKIQKLLMILLKVSLEKEVADLVEGVTKISALEEQAIDNSKAENLRKLILATSKDIRVLLVKLADRLHNMRTIETAKMKIKKLEKQKRQWKFTHQLADRMGMNRIRDELEDLSFSILNRDARKLILDRLSLIKSKKENTFKMISDELNQS